MWPLSDFKKGHLVLITEPDGQGVYRIAVEWCRVCFALVPEDFMVEHIKNMHNKGPLPT